MGTSVSPWYEALGDKATLAECGVKAGAYTPPLFGST
jgi:hypothetical protein